MHYAQPPPTTTTASANDTVMVIEHECDARMQSASRRAPNELLVTEQILDDCKDALAGCGIRTDAEDDASCNCPCRHGTTILYATS